MRGAEAEVHTLETKDRPKASAPAVGFSVVANLPGDRQITAQSFVAQESCEEDGNALIEKMLRVIDKQKARYELEQFESDLTKLEKTLRQYREDFERVEHDYAAKQETMNEKVAILRDEKNQIRNSAYEAFTASGRRGRTAENFELQGHDLANSNRKDAAIEAVIAQGVKDANERAQAKQNLEISVARYEEEIVKCKREIAKRKELLGLANDP